MANEVFTLRSPGGRFSRAAKLILVAMPLVTAAPAVLATGCGEAKEQPPTAALPQPAMVPGPKGQPLGPGDKFPPLTPEGWINGQPPAFDSPGVRLVVYDLWANWCPYCRQGAPHLIKLFNKYRDQGVAFVSISNMDESTVQCFAQQFAISWPNGYGLGAIDMAALGVGSGMPTPAYGLAPTLYLVDSSGRVCWCDQQGRVKHKESAEWSGQLDDAIRDALAKAPEVKK